MRRRALPHCAGALPAACCLRDPSGLLRTAARGRGACCLSRRRRSGGSARRGGVLAFAAAASPLCRRHPPCPTPNRQRILVFLAVVFLLLILRLLLLLLLPPPCCCCCYFLVVAHTAADAMIWQGRLVDEELIQDLIKSEQGDFESWAAKNPERAKRRREEHARCLAEATAGAPCEHSDAAGGTEAAHDAPSTITVQFVVPEHATAGQHMSVPLPDGRTVTAVVPEGTAPGTMLQIEVLARSV
eukprot:SAG11_NODE_6695_length_1265_cov_0.938250_1_plen_242_part_01